MNRITIDDIEIGYFRNAETNETAVSLPQTSAMWSLRRVMAILGAFRADGGMPDNPNDPFLAYLKKMGYAVQMGDGLKATKINGRDSVERLHDAFSQLVLALATNPFDRNYVAVIRPAAVRDVQFATTVNTDPMSDEWEDLEEAEVYLGVFGGMSTEQVLQAAARYGRTDPANIRLIPTA